MSTLSIHLLGSPLIAYNDKPINVDTRKAIALLAYLAVKNTVVSRDTLSVLLWPDYDETRARATLRRTLSVTHSALGKEWLSVEQEHISLKQSPDLFVDVNHFRTLIDCAHGHFHPGHAVCAECVLWLAEAIELYRDGFLAGFSLRDSIEFDQWQSSEAEQIFQWLGQAFDGVTAWYAQNHEFDTAIAYFKRWLQIDPLHEPARYRLMQMYIWAGQRAAALQQYKDFEALLDEELGVPPLQETIRLYESILKDDLRPVTLATPPASQGDNLPIYTKPFVGRSAEIQKVLEWLGTPSGRLLTVVGPGGIGKTRLVVEAVRRFAGQFQDGIYLVALQPVTLEDTTVAQIANAIGISFYHGGTLKKQLLDYLRHKKMLLILDNFESCLSETPLIAEILTHARDVRLLITSHERLNLQEEWLLHLQGLDFPHTDDTTIGNFSAALLFIEYARSVSSTFSPDGQEEAIAQICGILEGIPLALELAAHWAELLPCAEIASEISHSFDLLTTRLGNVPERHISLRSVFEYAWTRLSDELRLALRQLCIFQNGFTRQAANEITNASLSTLTALVQSSTLWTDGQGRYFIPQTIKKYAEEKHEVELVLIEENHSRYYAQFIAQLDLDGPGQSSALAQVKVEFDNILAGWNWAMTTLNAEILAVYCHPLYVFYEILSRFSEGQDTFGRAVDILSRKTRLSSEDRILLGRLKSRLGYFHTNLGDYDQALRLFDESLALQPSNYKEVAFIFNLIGVTCIARGQLSEARQHLEKSLEIYDELKEDLAAARVLNNLGMLANSQSDYTRAVNVLCQSLQTFRRFGSRRFMAAALNNLGNAAFASGDLISAEQYFNESYQLKDELGDNWGIACSLINLGHIAVAQGHQAQAKQAFSRSLDVCTRMGKQSGIAKALTALGSAASEEGNYAASSYYFLEALQLSLTIGARVTSLEVLKDIAAMLIKRGYLAEAAQIAHSIIKEPQTHRQTRQEAEKILHAISEVLPPHSHTETLDEIKERVLKNVYFPLIPLLQASSNVSVTDNS